MKSIFASSLILLLALAAVQGDDPEKPVPCTSPKQWEANYFSYDETRRAHAMGKMAYDAVNRRERFTESVEIGCDKEKFDILYLHDQKVEYVLNLKTKKCIKKKIGKPWIDFGIPPNSTFITRTVLGSLAIKDANLQVDLWTNEFNDPFGQRVRYMGSWTSVGCLPIESRYASEKYKFDTRFSDITPGAPDSRFTPDPECVKEDSGSNEILY